MPNRILKESICTSLEIDALNWFEEVLFYRLIVTADDYGICPADPVLLAHFLFPRKVSVTRKMMEDALKHLEKAHLIQCYTAGDKGVFLQLISWNAHQRLRKSRRKYPAPEDFSEETEGQPEDEPEEVSAAPAPARMETEDSSPDDSSPDDSSPEDSSPPVLTLPLNDGSEYPVTQAEADEYAALYPAVDILQELRAMRGWCLNNERRQKTRSGIRRFINSWMARAQDQGGVQAPPGRTGHPDNPYLTMACEGAVV